MKKADLVEAMLAEDAKKEKEKAAKESEKKQDFPCFEQSENLSGGISNAEKRQQHLQEKRRSV